MLGWLPFRSESLSQSLELFKIILDPNNYESLNMRENSYLACALILFSHFFVYFFIKKFSHFFKKLSLTVLVLEIIFLTFLISILIMNLRPINQFIYFQF